MSRVALQTLLDRSIKNMGSGMNSVVYQTALEVIRRAYAEGINVQLSAGMRTYAQQNALYAQGRTTPGSIVTNARGGYSNHNFGLAVDYFLTNNSGSTALWTVNNDWRRVAAIAKSLGFAWGGDWTSFRDYPHLEMVGGLSTAQLRAGRRPSLSLKFTPGTNSPAPSNPSTGNGGSAHVRAAQSFMNSRDYPKRHKGNFTPLVVDGLAGRLTKTAGIRIGQYYAAVAVDGIFGPVSRRSFRTLSQANHTKWWTHLLQSMLNCFGGAAIAVDGIFGTGTRNAVIAFQRSKGLSADGIAGPNTWAALCA